MPKWKITKTTELQTEVEAESSEEAVVNAFKIPLEQWNKRVFLYVNDVSILSDI